MAIGINWEDVWEDIWESVWEEGSVTPAPPQTVHAEATNTILHAAKSAGARNVIKARYTLIDEDGNTLVDEAGNILVSDYDDLGALVLHAPATNTIVHAE